MTEAAPPPPPPNGTADAAVLRNGSAAIDDFKAVPGKLDYSQNTRKVSASDSTALSDSVSKPDDETLNGNDKDGVPEPAPPSTNEFKEIATRLFNEDFVLIVPEEYTQFLASQDADSAVIREYYMDLFTWDASLMKSTRMLCLKLYLKGESQEIDRILSSFTKSYIKQHPVNVFCTRDFEKIYIVLYSLILLNTALHNSEVSKKSKISQSDYIRNTLTTFLQQNRKSSRSLSVKQKIQIERELNSYYEDLSRLELYLKKGDSRQSTPRKQPNTNRYSIAETIRSNISSGHNNEHDYEKSPSSPNPRAANGLNEHATVELSRQLSNSSIWSTDHNGGRRMSLAMKRMTSGASATSHITAVNSNMSNAGGMKSSRFGFTRALLSDNAHRSAANSLRNHKSLDHMRNLSRRSSHASIRTKDSNGSHLGSEDAVSMVSMDDSNLRALDIEGDNREQYDVEDFDVDDFQDRFDLKLELQGSPYLKEGLLKLKILNNDMADSASAGEQVASSAALTTSVGTQRQGFFSFFNRSFSAPKETPVTTTLGTNSSNVFSNKFVEYFVVVSKGELRLYSFDPKVIKKHQLKMKKIKKQSNILMMDEFDDDNGSDLGDGNWLKNAANIGNYNLCSTIAQIERAHGSPHSTKVSWSLTFPKVSKKYPKKFLFEAGTTEVANEFVNTCNFWASKITAVPTLEESMSSLEYGWTNLDKLITLGDGFKKTKSIAKWEHLPKGVYLSNYVISDPIEGEEDLNHEGMLKQFVQTLKYYNNLKTLYNTFNQNKTKFMKNFRRFSGTSNYKLIIANYENRSQEYKNELSKYKSYLVLLGYGLKLRFDTEADDKEATWLEDIRAKNPEIEDEALIAELRKYKDEDFEKSTELNKIVKREIDKMIKTSVEMNHIFASDPNYANADFLKLPNPEEHGNTSMVKSPKTFSLSNFKDLESSPINQLLTADGKQVNGDNEQGLHLAKKELIMSFSTNTIREEEEPEDLEDTLEMAGR